METLKNFVIGVSVLVLSLVIIMLVAFTWPFIIGISSFILSIAVVVLFIILIFYVVVFVGYLTRKIISR